MRRRMPMSVGTLQLQIFLKVRKCTPLKLCTCRVTMRDVDRAVRRRDDEAMRADPVPLAMTGIPGRARWPAGLGP